MVPLRELPWLLLIRLTQRRVVEGCEVRVAGSPADAEEVFRKAGDALRLIVEYGPRFHARLQGDVRCLLFVEASGGSYLAGLRTCRIGIGTARRVTPLDLAMIIVHEATHARLARAGFRYVGAYRERIERICVGAEIAFAQRVPGSEAALEKTRASLETQWWTPEKRTEAALGQLKELGVPAWLTKAVRWMSTRTRIR